MCKQLLLFLVFLIPLLINAQNLHIVRPDGTVKSLQEGEILPSQKIKLIEKLAVRNISQVPIGTETVLDTVYQRDFGWFTTNARFGFANQEVMIQWFEAPADMILKSVGFGEAPDSGPLVGTEVQVKVVSANWTKQDLTNSGVNNWGYYLDADSNAAPFMNMPGGVNNTIWVALDSSNITPVWGTDVWSDSGAGVPEAVDPLNASADPNNPTYHWVDMDTLGNEPVLSTGDIFGVAVTASDDVVRLWASSDGVPYGGWKYYPNIGWQSKEFAWDMAYVADISCTPYLSIDVTSLNTTLSTDPQTVIAIVDDEIPGGNPNVASVNLLWSTNGMSSWDSTAMVNTTGNEYVADIPGQSPGTIIDYYVDATDINGNVSASPIFQYRIFQASGAPTLLVFNGYHTELGYPQDYYFGIGDTINYTTFPFWHDVWAFGPLTMELLNYYTNVIEITTSGPEEINSDTIDTWLAASGDRNYMLAGDEWLGAQSDWPDSLQHFPGEFMYDVLGIEWEYNDIVNSYLDISRVIPVDGSLLGDSLHYLSGVNATDSMLYDPNFEITQVNWLDGVGFLGDVEIDIQGVSSRDISNGRIFPIGGHRTLAAGNKIAFLAYDPLSLNAVPYYWYGFSSTAPQVQFLRWLSFIIIPWLDIDDKIAIQFSLSQNYPNPFNPLTKIEYSLAKPGKVELIVFDILGREVVKLVNETKQAGKHEVVFDASNYVSGLYFYQLVAGKQILIKKMLFLK